MNRRYMTPAESALWECLRNKNLGVRFRRQHPVFNYIPDFVCLLNEFNKKACKPILYNDRFPMQYIGINYEYDYTGNIVLGVVPSQNKAGQRRYRKVFDLEFEVGILIESIDITEKWRLSINPKNKEGSKYWWENENHRYDYLVNYGLMEVDSLKNIGSTSG